ncbi:MAG: hypothetical protein ACRCTW_07690 [Lactococcus garvieae]
MNKLGMSFEEVMDSSYFKINTLLEGLCAVEAEDNTMRLKIASNHLLLNTKATAQNWGKLADDLRYSFRENGIKKVTTVPDLAGLQAMMQSKNGGGV